MEAQKSNHTIRRGKHVLAMAVAASTLSGCAAATIPLTYGASAAIVENKMNGAARTGAKVQKLSCGQIRAELAEMNRNKLGRFNPIGSYNERRIVLMQTGIAKGCNI